MSAAPGPGGGYTLAHDQRLAPLTLTVDEALGVLLSYDAFARYAQPPFAAEGAGLSAATKLRAALSPDALRELGRLGHHVAIIARPVGDPAPLLGDLLGYLCLTPRKGQSSCTERIVPLIPQILSATSRRGCLVTAR